MRVKLSKDDLTILFKALLKNGYSFKKIASKINFSVRTINDWRRGSHTLSLKVFQRLIKIAGVKKEKISVKLLPELWHIKNAARMGAYARMKLYGNVGTTEGRRKGGINSLKIHRQRKTNFQLLKRIKKPRKSKKLAELLGIFIGDGHLSEYQASVTTNSETDREHALFACNLIKNLFDIIPTLKKKKDKNVLNIVVSSKNIVQFLKKNGMPIGNKIKNNLSVPDWIFKKISYQIAFIRGLFDTDGCIYIDTHITDKKIYRYFGWAITSYADKLITDVVKILKNLEFTPTHCFTQKSVYLRKQKEIKKYFLEIGTSNPKHYRRYKKSFNLIGEVPKRS